MVFKILQRTNPKNQAVFSFRLCVLVAAVLGSVLVVDQWNTGKATAGLGIVSPVSACCSMLANKSMKSSQTTKVFSLKEEKSVSDQGLSTCLDMQAECLQPMQGMGDLSQRPSHRSVFDPKTGSLVFLFLLQIITKEEGLFWGQVGSWTCGLRQTGTHLVSMISMTPPQCH